MFPDRPIRLLIVDDSAVIRRLLGDMFRAEADIVLETARDGQDALDKAARFKPDVVTLDVAMPGMDGLACLRALPARHPCAVVMVSSLTAKGAATTLEALSLGAVDFIAKPTAAQAADLQAIRAQLIAKVRIASRARRWAPAAAPPAAGLPMPIPVAAAPVLPPRPGAEPALVLIGVSTGGPRALEQVLPRLPAHFPAPILVAQHMPATFTGVLARRLNERCALRVMEATEPGPIRPGTIAIAAGDRDLVVERDGEGLALRPVATDVSPWHPSADRLVRSAMACLPARRLVGVLLTGMGNDGAEAMAALQAAGGRTIAEAESTAVVFGMPGDLVRRGGATAVLPIERVAERLVEWCVPAASARRVAAV